MDAKTMRKVADNIRILEAAMVEKAKSGHPGGSMSGTDYVNTLYSKYIVYDSDDAKWFARDRFFLGSRTHVADALWRFGYVW